MTKKTENVKQEVAINPLLTTIAQKLGVKGENVSDEEVIAAIVERVELIEEKFAPLTTLIANDPRAYSMMEIALKGGSVEEIVAAVSNLQKEEGNSNYQQCLKAADDFCCNHNLEGEGVELFIAFIEEMVKAISTGVITTEVFELFWRSYNFAKEIEESYNAGVVSGKNSRIDAQREEREAAEALGGVAVGRNSEKIAGKEGYIEKLLRGKR